MALLVEGQVVRAGEAAVAVAALEGLDSGVLAVVARQFVRASELPRAAFPRAQVGLLTYRGRNNDLFDIFPGMHSGVCRGPFWGLRAGVLPVCVRR